LEEIIFEDFNAEGRQSKSRISPIERKEGGKRERKGEGAVLMWGGMKPIAAKKNRNDKKRTSRSKKKPIPPVKRKKIHFVGVRLKGERPTGGRGK